MGKNERVNNSQSTQVDNSQPTSQVDNTQPTSQVCTEIDKPAEKTGLLKKFTYQIQVRSKGLSQTSFSKEEICAKSQQSVRKNDPIHLSWQEEYSHDGIRGTKRGFFNRIKKKWIFMGISDLVSGNLLSVNVEHRLSTNW